MTAPASISLTLLDRVRRSDGPAWQRLVTLFGPTIRDWIHRGGVPAADQDDVVQEVFVKVSRALPGFRRDRPGDTFLGWLRTLVRHRVADYHAGRGVAARGGSDALEVLAKIPADSDEQDTLDGDAVLRRTVETLRDEFEDRTWQAFYMLTAEGLRADDVAERLGMSVGAVYVAKSRVLRRAREELGDLIV